MKLACCAAGTTAQTLRRARRDCGFHLKGLSHNVPGRRMVKVMGEVVKRLAQV
jgi:hypothetical protein